MKRPVTMLAAALLIVPALLVVYRVAFLGYRLFPAVAEDVWSLTMDARVTADRGKVAVRFGLPRNDRNRSIFAEQVTSGELDFEFEHDGGNRFGSLSGELKAREAFIRYQASLLVRRQPQSDEQQPTLGAIPKGFSAEDYALAQRLVAAWMEAPMPERLRKVAATLGGAWDRNATAEREREAWASLVRRQGEIPTLLLLLRASSLPARTVQGVRLAAGVENKALLWIEAWTGNNWESLRLATGKLYPDPRYLLPLSRGEPAVQVFSGKLIEIRWSLRPQVLSSWLAQFDRIRKSERWLDRWSLFHLPDEFQETFRILLLVPIGALMIGVLRNVIGFPSFGIFMPVLMALAFRSTGLWYGLGIFSGVILVGYAFRYAIDRLHLLLVPRLSLMLTLVIVFLTAFALIGEKVGLREFMAVGLLPIVILTMTIERFFIVVEEAGLREAFKTAMGSAAVASITYGILQWEPLQLTFFVYPELVFAVAALQLLLGRYTGFRISEIFRFRAFRGTG